MRVPWLTTSSYLLQGKRESVSVGVSKEVLLLERGPSSEGWGTLPGWELPRCSEARAKMMFLYFALPR